MKPLRIVVKNMDNIKMSPKDLGDWFFEKLLDNGFDPKQPVIMQPMLNQDAVEYIQYRLFWRWMWNVKIALWIISLKQLLTSIANMLSSLYGNEKKGKRAGEEKDMGGES